MAAQIASGLGRPTPQHDLCCDVDQSGAITAIDALLLASRAAGLAATISCP